MKQKNLYNVTVVGSFTKDILVWDEDEDAALDFTQSICDNTNLIRFDGDVPLDISVDDVEEVDLDEAEADEDHSSIKIIGNADVRSSADSKEASKGYQYPGCGNCPGGFCLNCDKTDPPDVPNHAPSSAGKEAKVLRRLSELLGGPFVGILID